MQQFGQSRDDRWQSQFFPGKRESDDGTTSEIPTQKNQSSPQRELTPETLRAIRSSHPALFCSTCEGKIRVLHALTHLPIGEDSYCTLLNKRADQLEPLKQREAVLVEAGCRLSEQLTEALSEDCNTDLADLASSCLYPFLSILELFTNELIALQREVAEEWIRTPENDPFGLSPQQKGSIVTDYESQCREIEGWLAQFKCNSTVADTAIDGNHFLAELSIAPEIDVTLDEGSWSIQMDPSHLSAACAIVSNALTSAAAAVHQRAIERVFPKHGVGVVTRNGSETYQETIEKSELWQAARHALFGRKSIHCGVLREADTLYLECEAPLCLRNDWETELASLANRLAAAAGIVTPYCGGLQCFYNQEAETIRVSLQLPMMDNSAALSEAALTPIYSEFWQSKVQEEPEQHELWFPYPITLNSGEVKTLAVHLAGAGLLTPVARSKLCNILKQAESYVRFIPTLNSLRLTASGFAQDFREAFESGAISISLEANTHSPKEQHSWDCDQQLSFSPESFFDQSVLSAIQELNKRVEIKHLPCKQDEEASYMGGANHAHKLVRAMTSELGQALDTVLCQLDEQRAQVVVIEHRCTFIKDIGSSDAIFTLRILDRNKQLIGVGSFSRYFKSWDIRLLDLPLHTELLTRIEPALALITSGNLDTTSVDDGLASCGISLPEGLITGLISAVRGKHRNEQTGKAITAAEFLEKALHDTHTTTAKRGDTLVVTRTTPPVRMISFGTIRSQRDDQSTAVDALFSFRVARLYYEEGDSSFTPNEAFVKMLAEEEQEDSSGENA